MKIAPNTPLNVSLHWSDSDIQPVGRLAYRDRQAYLEYDDEFIHSGLLLSPLRHQTSKTLETSYDPTNFEGLHGMFYDSLPDGWGRLLVDRRARQLNVEPATLTPLDRLAIVGKAGIGALTYEPVADVWGHRAQNIDVDALASYSRRVLEGEADDIIAELGRAGGSPGGARPKALIAINEQGHAIHGDVQIPDDYTELLIKFPGTGDPADIANIEMAYADMAKAAGIFMSECRLLPGSGDSAYFATERFDRANGNRLHVHSASGLLYSDIRIPALDYTDLVSLTRFVTRDQRQCEALFHLACFNVLAHNRDDHAKQFSFCMTKSGVWQLAPAYDLTYSQGPGGEHSTSVLGHGKDISRTELRALSQKADLNQEQADNIINATADIVSQWPTYAKARSVSNESTNVVSDAIETGLKNL